MKKKKKLRKSILLLLFPISSLAQKIDSSQFIIQTKQGALKGTVENGVYVWKGIQYAKAPVGDLRFKSPQPPERWMGVRDASEYGPVAPQINIVNQSPIDENCLNLNVWSPDTKNKKHPVMVWIHGGAFYTGAGSWNIYNGAKLSQKGDVVIVTINYRLGALGFLYFDKINKDTNSFINNIGIRDQIAALSWVKENIEAFGGDANNITIFGQSAGATSVLTLMSTPSAKGLFHKAIAESPPLNEFWTPDEATMVTKKYLALLGVPENNLEELYHIPAYTLAKTAYEMIQNFSSQIPGVGTFAPTVDHKYIFPIYENCTTTDTLKAGIPLLIGTNRNEANLFNKMEMIPFSAKEHEIERMIPTISDDEKERVSEVYKRKNIIKEQLVCNVVTDGVFLVPAIQYADAKSKCAPTYMYRFDWRSAPLLFSGYRSCHALDVFFVFNTFDTEAGKKVTSLARKKKVYSISHDMQQAWINFARTGNPNGFGYETWKPYDSEERATMIFDRKTKLRFDPNYKQRLAWQGIEMN